MIHLILIVCFITSLIALSAAWLFYHQILKKDPGTRKMQAVASAVQEGAHAYLSRQYKTVGIVFIVTAVIFVILAFFDMQSFYTPAAFLLGGFFSALSGYIGMQAATSASNRVTSAARHSLNGALQIAIRGGAVMGLVVVGFVLLNIILCLAFLYFLPQKWGSPLTLIEITAIMLTFGIGASFQALFARVGGGIYTKAADIGADLVGKLETDIPEDDPRNPAVIADSVGDNVGDVAGMGADLYESYAGSILSSMVLGVACGYGVKGIALPLFIVVIGIISSLIGLFTIKSGEKAEQNELMKAVNRGVYVASILTLVGASVLIYFMIPENLGFIGSLSAGLVAGVIIGLFTQYYTNSHYKPTQMIVQQSGSVATNIIAGLAMGMRSTLAIVITITAAMFLAFLCASGFGMLERGVFGISLAAVGMLSTLGITLAVDAYGPIADNAGGNAQMANLPAKVRERTDNLDMLGNTTAAIGKGFAIGSAALTAIALVSAYIEQIRMVFIRSGVSIVSSEFMTNVPVKEARLEDLVEYLNINLANPLVLTGLFIGATTTFWFCSFTLESVGRTALKMVDEVRRQFKEITGILEGKAKPDYARCVDISTLAAQKEMVKPAIAAILIPIAVGLLFGVAAVMGLMVGIIVSGFAMAIFMANSGGAWDNAKKHLETTGQKHRHEYQATVIGDTVGDPFKDTSGPSLNILIKLIAMTSIVTAGLIIKYNLFQLLK
jgi:K(+)-stimulated pyrophosphate-energized sodium pump